MRTFRRITTTLTAMLALVPLSAAAPNATDVATTETALVSRGIQTGLVDFWSAPAGSVIHADPSGDDASVRAYRFLAQRGAQLGLEPATLAAAGVAARTGSWPAGPGVALEVERIDTDELGAEHVRLRQTANGLPVFAGQLFVHLNDEGVTAVNGEYIPGSDLSAVPSIDARQAAAAAVQHFEVGLDIEGALLATDTVLSVYRTGLVEGLTGETILAWEVTVEGNGLIEQAWVDAKGGEVITSYSKVAHARDRCTYTPTYQEDQPAAGRMRTEEQGPTFIPPIDNLHRFAGQVYDFFDAAFDRDSWDGEGGKMISVYLVTQQCPNAFWNGTSTNYCPAFDADDVVAHEWGHAYTERTHDLVYAFQSGALNESYSDIWGETVDLLNGEDAIGGSDNDAPYPNGQRWLLGEDLGEEVQALLLRDMWDPERLGQPGKVTSDAYACGTGDQGGVHQNSGVPNHAYAALVDGKEFEGVGVAAIGLTKAAHIYWRAGEIYQHQTTQFVDHANALTQSCADLMGVDLKDLLTGEPSGEVIDDHNCEQIDNAMQATEMRVPPDQCGFQPLAIPGDVPFCPGSQVFYTEDFSDGLDGWSGSSNGVFPLDWPGFEWEAVSGDLAGGRTTDAIYAIDNVRGTCTPGGDYSGSFEVTSPDIALPADGETLRMRFDHLFASEFFFDGGNVKVSVNGGGFQVVPQGNYEFNRPPSTLSSVEDQNTNPMAGEWAFNGIEPAGAEWVTSVINLTGIASPGDTINVRFDFGMDGCNGIEGWYIDSLTIYDCPTLEAPALALGDDYEDPDADGSYTLEWQRPAGAVGPDHVEVSAVDPLPFADDASAGLDNWVLTSEATGDWATSSQKPGSDAPTFYATADENVPGATAIMTLAQPVTLEGAGTARLSFTSWFMNEGDDAGFVEISVDGGTTWTSVHNAARSELAPVAAEALLLDPMSPVDVDLTHHLGRDLLLRFRYLTGADNRAGSTPLGWHVDDVAISLTDFQPLDSVAGTSLQVSVPKGVRFYRVRSTYLFDGVEALGPYSEPVRAESTADGAPTGGGEEPAPVAEPEAPLPTTGGGAALAGLLALAAASRRKRRSG